MIGTAILLALLLIATFTDLRYGKIYNWTTYPGILIALAASGLATLLAIDVVDAADSQRSLFGLIHIWDCIVGLLACGVIMLVCYVLFAGGIGGGDVKLVAMLGAFLGLYAGLEALLWTFTIGACLALIRLVWQYGAIKLSVRVAKYVTSVLRSGRMQTVDEQDREKLKTHLYLSPSALLAVLIVRFQVVELF